MTKTIYNANAPYPFMYQTVNGFVFAGCEHSISETIAVYLTYCANLAARHILYGESCVYFADMLNIVHRYTGTVLDYGNYWNMVEEKLDWYHVTYGG